MVIFRFSCLEVHKSQINNPK